MYRDTQTVIIVKSDGREARYAQWLVQMIGTIPNIELSQPWTESEYKASFPTVEKVIFFGNGKEMDIQGKAVNWQYDCFGMKYGWLGNRCVITADPDAISLKEQSAFAKYYNSQISSLRSILELQEIHYSETETLDMGELNETRDELMNAVQWTKADGVFDKATKTAVAAVAGVTMALANALKGVADTVENIGAAFERGDIWKRQYELLICEFITHGFTPFMNNCMGKNAAGQCIIVYDSKDAEYAHLLQNLMQQYGYHAAEYTEKMFIDNAKELAVKNKILFLGRTKASKERCIDRYMYDENGMRYGWIGNHAFIYAKKLKSSKEKEAFKEIYRKKSKEYENKAKSYVESNECKIGRKAAAGSNLLSILLLPGTGILAYAVQAGINYKIGEAVDKIINDASTSADLHKYQYQLLLREFVFDGLEKFMEGK